MIFWIFVILAIGGLVTLVAFSDISKEDKEFARLEEEYKNESQKTTWMPFDIGMEAYNRQREKEKAAYARLQEFKKAHPNREAKTRRKEYISNTGGGFMIGAGIVCAIMLIAMMAIYLGAPAEGAAPNKGRFFAENGMLVTDVEVLSVKVEAAIAKMMERHQTEMIQKTLDLSDAAQKAEKVKKLAEFEREEAELAHKNKMYVLALNQKATEEKMANEAAIAAMKRAEEAAGTQAKADMQKVLDAIHKAQLARDRAADNERIETEKQLAAIEEAKQKAYAETVAKVMESIQPELVAALEAKANVELANGIGAAVAPYALAEDESAADVVNKIIRGMPFEDVLNRIGKTSE